MHANSFQRYLLLWICFSFWACSAQEKNMINGVSFVAPPKEFTVDQIKKPQEKVGANFLSIMPYAYVSQEQAQLYFNSKWQWWGERTTGAISSIAMAHANGYQVMLKPQVWIRHGSFTGHHEYQNENDWKQFEDSYSNFILTFARIADSMQVEVFCIGTEWEKFVVNRPHYWTGLIQKVKEIYSGKLTYAANWDEYKKVPFWNELDYVGVDAYFPLLEDLTPNVEDLNTALIPYKNELKTLSQELNKSILFTEYGYRSRDKTAEKPWEADRVGEANLEAQINAYEAFYQTFWNEPFITGGFIWKWFPNYEESGGEKHNGFSPQNKPVEKTIKKYYRETYN